ncbi:paraquat-inducible protein A [Psychromonas sp. L1A2]|uniref:paraquat-inducible protein A n=1 Tax=Psychromonas sp. L1A2 TaxID=2686356 RepID=UPI00135B3ED2|nr:paraquat-inducible protein A [Psychromonas sp. L1A2]
MKTIICSHCDMVSQQPIIQPGYIAKCARCNHVFCKATTSKPNKVFALAVAALLVCIPAFSFPLVSVHLLGITEQTNLLQGAIMMINIAPVVSFVVLFCAVVAPTLLTLCIAFSSGCMMFNKRPELLNYVLKLTSIIIHWSMLEVYLVSFMVAVFKLTSYAELYFNSGLYFLVGFLILNMSMISEYDNAQHWKYLLNE